eukprot:TRINITY_DN3082_c2_g1_i1.p1 TRINITY_DN3082_c2_g1~~TRINITY_DN3082_c2_g1_i1.p1  ORF type:complete len:278 (-),score=73.02 TRINITY_DN3082_c2_g1_i1:231-1064(-)
MSKESESYPKAEGDSADTQHKNEEQKQHDQNQQQEQHEQQKQQQQQQQLNPKSSTQECDAPAKEEKDVQSQSTELPVPIFPPPMILSNSPGMAVSSRADLPLLPPPPPPVLPLLEPRAANAAAAGAMTSGARVAQALATQPPNPVEAWTDFLSAFKRYSLELANDLQQKAALAGNEEADPTRPAFVAPALGGLRSDKVCINHMWKSCLRGNRCQDKHPPQAQFTRIRQELKRKQCSFGDKCIVQRCLFFHPREAAAAVKEESEVVADAKIEASAKGE